MHLAVLRQYTPTLPAVKVLRATFNLGVHTPHIEFLEAWDTSIGG